MEPYSRPSEAEARLRRIQRIRQKPVAEKITSWVAVCYDPDQALVEIEAYLRQAANPIETLDRWEKVNGLGPFAARIAAKLGNEGLARVLDDRGATDTEARLARMARDGEGILAGLGSLFDWPVSPNTPEEAWAMALEGDAEGVALASKTNLREVSSFGNALLAIGPLAREELVPGEPPGRVFVGSKPFPEGTWNTVAAPPESLLTARVVTDDLSAEAPWAGSDWWAMVWACHVPLTDKIVVPRPAWAGGLLARLVQIKSLTEAERSPTHSERRRVNLDDVWWSVDLAVLSGAIDREPLATKPRIEKLKEKGLLSPLEAEAMADAHSFLLETRLRLGCLGLSPETVPENPDKLHRVARSFGMDDGNAFLGLFEGYRAVARRLLMNLVERLQP